MTRRALLAAAMLLAGCSGDGGDAPGEAPVEPVTSTTRDGEVTLTVTAPGRIAVGERLALTVEITAPPEVVVRMPALDDAVGPFEVRARRTPPDVPLGVMRLFRHEYELDTFATGEVEIPSLTVEIGEPPRALASEPMTIEVSSVLAAGEGEGDWRDIRDAVTVPGPGGRASWWLLGAAAAIAAAIVVLLVRRRRLPTETAAAPLPAHVRALAELDRLEAERLAQQGVFDAFYVRLSGIVREYVEGRFGLMAPERTTEEFLREARGHSALREDHKELLAGFLRAADLVKFARHEPALADADEALRAARRFVQESAPPLEAAA